MKKLLIFLFVALLSSASAQKIKVIDSTSGVESIVTLSGGATIATNGTLTLAGSPTFTGLTLTSASSLTNLTIASMLAPSFTAGSTVTNGVAISWGVAETVDNYGRLLFHYEAAGDDTNYVALGVGSHSPGEALRVYWDKIYSLGPIELGHATDTTLARSAAGQVTIEGVQILTQTSTATGITNKTFTAPVLMAPVIGDGTGATAILASNLSGATDPTITFGNALVTVSSGFTVTGVTTLNGNVSFTASSVTLGAGTALGYSDAWFSRTATGTIGLNGGLSAPPQAVATTDGAAAAANLTTLTSTFVTGASSATTTTLAAGTNGQIKIISLITDGGQNLVVTVTNPFWGGSGTLTFDDAGDNVTLIYLNAKWQILTNNGVTSG